MWVLPTRGRPDRCQKTLDSLKESGVFSETSWVGVIVVDGEDELPLYKKVKPPPGWYLLSYDARQGVCGVLNETLRSFPDEDFYGFISDDSIVRAGPGWDARLVEAAGPYGFANTADGFNSGKRMHGAVVFGGDLLRRLGWWAPAGLTHSFCDDAWERIGRAAGNWTFLGDILVEHQHFGNGKAEQDATYDLAYSSFQADKAAFEAWLADEGVDRAVDALAPILPLPETRRLNRMKRASVMIASPVYRDCAWQYTRALVDTCLVMERAGIYHRAQMVIGNSNLPRARNELVAEFLASDCNSLLFIDSDMGWVPNDVLRLLASEHEVIGGVGRKRSDTPSSDQSSWCAWFLGQELKTDSFGAISVGGVGTGFLKIDRSAFERIARAQPHRKRRPLASQSEAVGNQFYEFFRFSDGPNGECIGEDYHFCDTWRNLGQEVWIDPAIKLTHVGSHAFTGSIEEIFEAP
jgi:hypothetical protein